MARGFLPSRDPVSKLPERYLAWDELGGELPAFINAGVVRKRIERLPLIQNPEFDDPAEYERAMLLLSFFAHAFVHASPGPAKYVPENVAIPWIKISKVLQRKPILSHPSLVLQNWRRLDDRLPIQLNNLATQCQFHGGLDESWFFLVTVEVEQVGARAIPLVLEVLQCVERADFSKATHLLREVNRILEDLTAALRKMYLFCDPHIFFRRVRPFLASFEEIEYRGCGLLPQSHHGGSAAQSSLLQFFDAAFGIEYEEEQTREYLQLMRRHMPFLHARFLAYVEDISLLRSRLTLSKEFEAVYQEAVELLLAFRNEHLKMVALYIIKPARDLQAETKGTGGTNPMIFLKSVRNQNEALLGEDGSRTQ